ncbi:MAG: TonB family protein [Cytophagales bacterium]|nr:TonB family protein [Cytophagales bacterium]
MKTQQNSRFNTRWYSTGITLKNSFRVTCITFLMLLSLSACGENYSNGYFSWESDSKLGSHLMSNQSPTGSGTLMNTKNGDDKTLSPYFFIKSDDPSTDQMPLSHTSAEVNIAGVIADVKIKQVYKNEGTKTLEAIYIFPASTRAAVYGMKMIVGKRTLIAKIEKREKARKDYEQARQQGRTASLLEQQRPNVFQMNVANILPGDTITVELSYTELLIPEDGIYEFVYPTVVGPRYSNQSVATASASSDLWVANPYLEEGVKPDYTFDIKTNINAGLPVQQVTCISHDVNINFDGAVSSIITLKESEKHAGNKDFILRYRLAGNQIESGLLLYEGKENFFLMMLQPPKRVTTDQIPPREYVFVVDVSGSMRGFPLDISKKILRDLISKLRAYDKFNVLLFAGTSSTLAEQSLPATSANITKAIQFIEKQRGGGGTELLPALNRAINLKGTEEYSRTVVILTDGYVRVEKEAFDLIRKNLSTANFFTFGIGSSVNRYIIEGMARVGMGEHFVVTKPDKAEEKADKFRKYIQFPVLTNAKLDFGGLDVYDVEPYSIPDLLAERPVIVFGKWRGNNKGKITLNGISGNKKYSKTIDAAKIKPDKGNSALRYLWARHRITLLDDYNKLSRNDERIKEVTNIGLKYNLLTAYTSFVAIDSERRNADGLITTVKQPLPLPEGVSNYAVGRGGVGATGAAKVKKYSYRQDSNNSFSSRNIQGKPVPKADMIGAATEELKEEETEKVFLIVEKMPEFPGGVTKLMEFIKSNIIYPKSAKEKGIAGTVYISFVVDIDGSIRDIKVVKGINKELDKEALRVIKLMPRWNPGEQRGKAVAVKYTLQVKFTL